MCFKQPLWIYQLHLHCNDSYNCIMFSLNQFAFREWLFSLELKGDLSACEGGTTFQGGVSSWGGHLYLVTQFIWRQLFLSCFKEDSMTGILWVQMVAPWIASLPFFIQNRCKGTKKTNWKKASKSRKRRKPTFLWYEGGSLCIKDSRSGNSLERDKGCLYLIKEKEFNVFPAIPRTTT